MLKVLSVILMGGFLLSACNPNDVVKPITDKLKDLNIEVTPTPDTTPENG